MSIFKLLFGGFSKNPHVTVLSREDYKAQLSKEKVQLVDVRTPAEYKTGHIKGAVNIDYFQSRNFKEALKNFNTEEPIYIYCRSGNRSRKAANLLSKLGFTKIYDLQGGILNWK